MNEPTAAPTTFYRPAEVATLLHCSEWWVKEQARKRRIPFCWIGGSYRFTDEHIAEIAQLFEVRPTEPVNGSPTTQPVSRRSSAKHEAGSSAGLTARIP